MTRSNSISTCSGNTSLRRIARNSASSAPRGGEREAAQLDRVMHRGCAASLRSRREARRGPVYAAMLDGFGEAEHRHGATRCVALMPPRCAAEVNEPLRTAACAGCLSSVLQEGRENANIDVGL